MSKICKALPALAVLCALAGAPAVSAAVVVNEIMYHPVSDDRGDEYVELYNTGGTAVALDNWCLQGVEFCFPPGASIPAGEAPSMHRPPILHHPMPCPACVAGQRGSHPCRLLTCPALVQSRHAHLP